MRSCAFRGLSSNPGLSAYLRDINEAALLCGVEEGALAAQIAEGDPQARAVMARFGWWLALGLANLSAILDPEVIVLGGGMVEAGAVLLEPARQAFAALVEGGTHRPPIRLVAARLGERAGAIGAALLARGVT